MPEMTTHFERLPEGLRESVRAYAQSVGQTAGADALALAFYGLVVSGKHDAQVQPARNVLVLEKIDLDMLRRLGEQGSRYGKRGIAAPIVMTPEYISGSLDTFPLELLEIQQQNVLVFGKDFFGELIFDDSNVRIQCERELKVALLAMHESLLHTAGRGELLGQVVAEVAEGLVRILRGIAWLKGIRERHVTKETIADVEKALGRKLPGVWAALDGTQRRDWGTFHLLYDDISALGNLIDAM